MDATIDNDPCLVEKKFPDCVFKSFLGLEYTASPVLNPFPIIFDKDIRNSSTSGTETALIDPISTINPSVCHESGAQPESSSGQATWPTKPLPRRSARNRPSAALTQVRPGMPKRTSAIRHASKCPVQKILNGISNAFYNKRAGQWKKWPKTNESGKEEEIANYLNDVVNAARHFARNAKSKLVSKTEETGEKNWAFSAQYANTPLESDGAKRKPDIVVISRDHVEAEVPGSWADDIRAIGEVKKKSTFSLSKLTRSLTEYARLCFGHQRTRRFVLGFSLLDTKMRLWKFDRSGVLNSHEFDVHENPLDFLRIILSLIVGDDYYLGLDPSFTVENNKDWVMLNNKRYEIFDTIHLDSVVRGRGTVALVVRDEDGRYLVMKDQWVDRSRKTKEFAMLESLKEGEVRKVAGLVDYQIIHFKVGDEVVRDSTESDRNSEELREKVRKKGVETRDHYRLLISPYGDKLENFRSLKELISVFKDYVEVIEDLYKNKIVHRDISPRNVILVEDGKAVPRKGYIIDFDYAIHQSRQESARAERTGTLPFMAIDVLLRKNVPHNYYHDLESLFYVLLWICLTQDGPRNKRRPASEFNFKGSPLYLWCRVRDGNELLMKQVGLQKLGMMSREDEFKDQVLLFLPEYFKPLENLLLDLRETLFRDTPRQKGEREVEDHEKSISDRKKVDDVFKEITNQLDEAITSLPNEEQSSDVFNRKTTLRDGTDARAGVDVDPQIGSEQAQIPDLIQLRPLALLPAESEETRAECERSHRTSELLRAAVTSSVNQLMTSRGEKRSHDQEPASLTSSAKRPKRSSDDE